jgi:hypothetical protein
MTKLWHMTDRIVDALAECVASGHAASNKNKVARRIYVVHDYTAVEYYSEALGVKHCKWEFLKPSTSCLCCGRLNYCGFLALDL